MLPSRRLAFVALGLVALSLAATAVGFFAAWESTEGSVPLVGDFALSYHLAKTRVLAGGEWHEQRYDARDSDASESLRRTMLVQTVASWASVALALVAAGLLAAPLFGGGGWMRGATLATLGLLAVTTPVGASLFARNFPLTDEGDMSEGSEPSTFWGERQGFSWGPGPAWFGELAAGVFALGALGAFATATRRATSSPSTDPRSP